MGLEIGDLVWAKMKGFPPWPAQIVEPHANVKVPKSKKPHSFVQFFGTKDHAWIPEENINPHTENFLATISKKKSKAYQQAIDELLSYRQTEGVDRTTTDDLMTSEIKGKPENEKKSTTRVVKIIHSEPKKRKRNVLTCDSPIKVSKSSIKKVSKKRHISKAKADSCKLDTVDGNSSDVSSSNRHSVERQQSFENLPGCSSNYDEQYISDRELGMLGAVGLDPEDSETKVKNIGFIGLENLGKVVFLKFIEHGMDVTLWGENMDQYKEFIETHNVKLADSPAQLIINCDVTFCYDTDSDAFKNIIFRKKGILEGLEEAEKLRHSRKGYVVLNSVDYEISKEINDAITVKSGYYLEAPIVGTFETAVEGKLLVLASGSRKLFVSCENCFRAISSKTFFVSCEIGFSSKLSVLLNAVTGTLYAALNEALALADKLNLHKGDVHTIFGRMLQGDTIEKKVQRMSRHHESEPITPLKHVQKGLNLAMGLADEVSQSMPVTSAANEIFKHARLLKFSDSDISAIYKVIKLF